MQGFCKKIAVKTLQALVIAARAKRRRARCRHLLRDGRVPCRWLSAFFNPPSLCPLPTAVTPGLGVAGRLSHADLAATQNPIVALSVLFVHIASHSITKDGAYRKVPRRT